MLKWFFLLLVVVNLGVYLWGVQKENARQSQEIIATPGMGNLRMISELEKGDELPVAQNSPSTADSAPVPSQPEPAVVAKVDQPKSPAPAAPPTKEVVTPAAPDHVETSDSLLLQQNIADTEAKHFDLTTNQELIADTAVIHAPQPVVAEETEAQREPVTQALPQQFCGSIGPEEDHAQMSKLQSILTRQGIEAVLREEDLEKTVGYWVMVPPLENKEAAVALILRLRKEGVKDIRRFNKGEERNGVSLGVFSRRQNAENRRAQISKKGVEVVISARTRTVKGYRLDYRAIGASAGTALEGAVSAFPGVVTAKKSCQSIANL